METTETASEALPEPGISLPESRVETSNRGARRPGSRSVVRELVWVALAGVGSTVALGLGFAAGGWGAGVGVAIAFTLLFFVGGRWVRLQRQIQAVATEWQLTIDAVRDPILTLDAEGRILRLNRAAMELSGRSYRENIGCLLSDLGSGEPWRTASARWADPDDESSSSMAPIEDAETHESWEVAVSTVPNPGQAQPTSIVVARNVTELVALQESLHREELMSAMGALVAGVTHDMRSFLVAIQGTVRLMESSVEDRERQLRLLKMLGKQGDRMNSLLHTLLDYGKPVERLRSQVAIGEVIQEAFEVCDTMAKEKGVRLEARTETGMPRILLDRTRALQVFKNLLENAVQHSAPGGRVGVETARVDGWIESRIRDSGPGLPAVDHERIFEPFFTRRAGGTGLGLATARLVVEQHGGRIEATNHPQGGAVFRVKFPVAPKPA